MPFFWWQILSVLRGKQSAHFHILRECFHQLRRAKDWQERGHVTHRTLCCSRSCRGGFTHRLFLRAVVKLLVGTTPDVEVRIRPAGRGCPHHPRPDVQDALRTEGAVARAAGDHHQEQLRAANRPSDPRPAAGPLVLGESAADSRTQSGPRRAPEASAPRRRPQIGSTATATMRGPPGTACGLRASDKRRRSRPLCPLWVKSRHCRRTSECPLYPQKRTLELNNAMSALCQKRTFLVGQRLYG